MKDNSHRPSLKDVAARAGVSQATVSAVLNNTAGKNIRVGEATRARIVEALRETGYVANPAARVLAGAGNNIVAVFTYESVFPFQHRSFYYPFLVSIEGEAERAGYDLLFMTSATGTDRTRSIYRNGVNRLWLADGGILLGLQKNEDEIRRLVRERFPFVIIGHRDIPGVEPSYVSADYTSATKSIVEGLIDKGHRKIALLRVPEESEPGADREIGYRAALTDAGIPLDESLTFSTDPGSISDRSIRQLLDQDVTAIITERFNIAESVLGVVEGAELSVPEDVSIAVLGGPHEEQHQSREWTTLLTPAEEMATSAFQLLEELMRDPSKGPLRTTLKCQVVEGNTTGPAPTHRRR